MRRQPLFHLKGLIQRKIHIKLRHVDRISQQNHIVAHAWEGQSVDPDWVRGGELQGSGLQVLRQVGGLSPGADEADADPADAHALADFGEGDEGAAVGFD